VRRHNGAGPLRVEVEGDQFMTLPVPQRAEVAKLPDRPLPAGAFDEVQLPEVHERDGPLEPDRSPVWAEPGMEGRRVVAVRPASATASGSRSWT
jgi:hypothetical protein